MITSKNINRVALVFLGFTSLVFLFFYATRPVYNWDIIGYVGTALGYESTDISDLHRDVYSRLKKSAPPDRYVRLVGAAQGSFPGTATVAEDPEAFRQHLTFYQVRIVYTATIYLLWKLGVDPVFATHLISAVSAFMIFWAVGYLFPNHKYALYLIFVPFISFAFGLNDVARASTPDGLGTLASICAYMLLLRRNVALLFLFPVLVLIRLDYIILIAMFLLYLFVFRVYKRPFVVVSGIVTIAAYQIIQWHYGYYDIVTNLNYSYDFGNVPYPETQPFTFTFVTYLDMLKNGLASAAHVSNRVFFFFVICLGLSGILLFRRLRMVDTQDRNYMFDLIFFLVSSACYVAAHFLVFPRFWDRFFTGQYMMVACLLVYLILDWNEKWQDRSGDVRGEIES